MDLCYYRPSSLETWVNDFYKDHSILSVEDLKIERIAEIFGVSISYRDHGKSYLLYDEEEALIVLNTEYGELQTRKAFFHELGHTVQHVGIQTEMPKRFADLQEFQANHFLSYASMPIYLIKDYINQTTNLNAFELLLMETFKIPLDVVRRRIEQIKNKVYDQFMNTSWAPERMESPIYQFDWRYNIHREY